MKKRASKKVGISTRDAREMAMRLLMVAASRQLNHYLKNVEFPDPRIADAADLLKASNQSWGWGRR
ncbi:hypothetical protein [Noviluteimonas gilva]|uniref:Uncharacterized protein n=1 Tax=Noviluteimonas gilva TaxID=2682097 RepID=A0A7C9MMQ1_9GAMM|nr:hypothetical protein [Lysobacter gilvus]MUV14587.1 hypothetical protein [Lysobacter gilvus]